MTQPTVSEIGYTDVNGQVFVDRYHNGQLTERSISFVEDGGNIAERWEHMGGIMWLRVVDRFNEQGRLLSCAIETYMGFPRSPAHPIFAATQPDE